MYLQNFITILKLNSILSQLYEHNTNFHFMNHSFIKNITYLNYSVLQTHCIDSGSDTCYSVSRKITIFWQLYKNNLCLWLFCVCVCVVLSSIQQSLYIFIYYVNLHSVGFSIVIFHTIFSLFLSLSFYYIYYTPFNWHISVWWHKTT